MNPYSLHTPEKIAATLAARLKELRLAARRLLLALADEAGLSRSEAEKILAEVTSSVSHFEAHADATGVQPDRARQIGLAIRRCLDRLA